MKKTNCPKCGGYAQLTPSVSPDYERIECFGELTIKDRYGKDIQKRCGYRGHIKVSMQSAEAA